MIRTFQTTTIRRQQELTEHLWEFEALEGDKAGEKKKGSPALLCGMPSRI